MDKAIGMDVRYSILVSIMDASFDWPQLEMPPVETLTVQRWVSVVSCVRVDLLSDSTPEKPFFQWEDQALWISSAARRVVCCESEYTSMSTVRAQPPPSKHVSGRKKCTFARWKTTVVV
jgi:hypothetical protein